MKHSKLKQSITIILAVFLAITLLGALGIWLYQRDQAAKDAYRCYVFEDLLQPGMTREQVEDILRQFGEYRVNQSNFTNLYMLDIYYPDQSFFQRFGTNQFVLEFWNDRYKSAYRLYGSDTTIPLCKGRRSLR